MAIKRFLHCSICVSNYEKSLAFYQDILGFEVVDEQDWAGENVGKVMDVGDTELKVALLRRDGQRLELVHYDKPKSPPRTSPPKTNHLGLSHMTVGVDSVEDTIRELKEKGVKVLERTIGSFVPEYAEDIMFLFEDPDGNLIECYAVPPQLPYDAEPSL